MIYALIILNLAGALTWTGYVWISGIMEPGPADTATLCAGALLLAVAIIVLPIAVFLMFESWALQLKSRQAHHDMISDIKDDLPSCLHRLITLHPDKGFNIGFSRKGVYVHVADPVDRCSIDFPHLDPEEEQNLLALMKRPRRRGIGSCNVLRWPPPVSRSI
jgi:hypothetical protein